MPKFDVIEDSWIDVCYCDGSQKTVSLRKAFEDAKLIKELNVNSGSYIDEYGVYCLLYVFFQRSHKIENPRLLEKLVDTGFDMRKFDDYVSAIRKTTSTNIFDEERPWMQMKDPAKPKDVGDVNVLLPPVYPKGNNTVSIRLFDDPVIGRTITPKQYILGLLRLHRFAPMGGRGYSTSVLTSVDFPVFVVPLGNNLLETIVAGTPLYSSKYESEKPFWEIENGYLTSEELFGSHSWSANAFIPTRYIHWLEASDDGLVQKLHCRPIAYKDIYRRTIWVKRKYNTLLGMEPHVLKGEELKECKPNEKKNGYDNSSFQCNIVFTLKDLQKSLLPLIADIAGLKGSKYEYQLNMDVANQVLDTDSTDIRYKMYGAIYNQAVVEEQYMQEIKLPFFKLDESDPTTEKKNDAYQRIVDYVEKRKKTLSYSILVAFGEDGIEPSSQSKRLKEARELVIRNYGTDVSDYFAKTAVKELGKAADEDAISTWEKDVAKVIKWCSIEVFKENINIVRGNPTAFEKALSILSSGNKDVSMPSGWDATLSDLKTMQGTLKGMPKRHVLQLRRDCGKPYGRASIDTKIIFNSLPECSLRDSDKRFAVATILASALVGEIDKPQVTFEEVLAELYKRNPSSAMRVNRLLMKDNPWDESTLTAIITIARNKPCDICRLLADLYYWEKAKERWAQIIGKKEEN